MRIVDYGVLCDIELLISNIVSIERSVIESAIDCRRSQGDLARIYTCGKILRADNSAWCAAIVALNDDKAWLGKAYR